RSTAGKFPCCGRGRGTNSCRKNNIFKEARFQLGVIPSCYLWGGAENPISTKKFHLCRRGEYANYCRKCPHCGRGRDTNYCREISPLREGHRHNGEI
ncbi:unnamed protein product, partial [Staurois parvus]